VRILHLAYEDPWRPGSGGGSTRTWELTTRLSRQHEITVIVAGYPGARERFEAGARWVPVGSRRGLHRGTLSYFALLPRVLRREPHDLVVEDFGAPFSTGFSPLYTRKPVVASVQWLFARDLARKYRLPFYLVERAGLPLYQRFIVVSDWLRRHIVCRRPGADACVIPNGVDEIARTVHPAHGAGYVLFLGRLDAFNKGLDLLVAAYRQIADRSSLRLVIAGEGPDRNRLQGAVHRAGMAHLVHFAGRVDGEAKYDLLARADAVLVPSRFETFGMVVLEAAAAGAPVVAFDVGPLKELVGPVARGQLVRPFDADAFADAAVALAGRPPVRTEDVAAIRERFSWDAIAEAQDACYRAAVEGRMVKPGR
jgi:glycogen(starch) synthase